MIAFSDIADFIVANIIWVIVGAAVILAALVLLVIARKKAKTKDRQKITQVEETKDARYSVDAQTQKYDGSAKASYIRGDIIVSRGQTIVAGKGNDVLAGKYTVLTSVEGVEAFNISINGFVREVQHNSVVILGEGDTFCPVSHSVILR